MLVRKTSLVNGRLLEIDPTMPTSHSGSPLHPTRGETRRSLVNQRDGCVTMPDMPATVSSPVLCTT